MLAVQRDGFWRVLWRGVELDGGKQRQYPFMTSPRRLVTDEER